MHNMYIYYHGASPSLGEAAASHANVTCALVEHGLGAVLPKREDGLLCLRRPHPVCGPWRAVASSRGTVVRRESERYQL